MTLIWPLLAASPIIVGVGTMLLKSPEVARHMDEFGRWLGEAKIRNGQQKGFASRWVERPLLFGLVMILRRTQEVRHDGLRSGLRLIFCSYYAAAVVGSCVFFTLAILAALYIIMLIIIGVVIGVLIFAYALKVIISRDFSLRGVWSRAGDVDASEEAGGNEYSTAIEKDRRDWQHATNPFVPYSIEKVSALFGEEFGELREDGKIYSKGIIPEELGYIDKDGVIWDIRQSRALREKRGRVDREGRVEPN